jgi:hypothetical protein
MRSVTVVGIWLALLLLASRSPSAPAPLYRGPAVRGSQPLAELYAPLRDKDRPDTLEMSWKAWSYAPGVAIRSISLQWATRKAGPWYSIGQTIMAPETTRCAWRSTADVPPRVYLRLTVRDSAGQTAVAETEELYRLPR